MTKIEIMNRLFKMCCQADLERRCAEELMELINKENPTINDYVDMIIRAQYMLDTAKSVSDQYEARFALNEIKSEFYEIYPEEYENYFNDYYKKGN